ncbi:Protein of unknown function [Cotesia congregata]|uniref:Uncharacterized protein n=1 Tax=Cotesia congregata TaxID=51543 RepID=A0A8J2HBX6_COTCN|nr:Protein of unknown function [Cotesia congregata]
MKKFRTQLSKIANGFIVKTPNQLEPIIVTSMLISGTADTPAKSDFLNFVRFNGAFGCAACCIKGSSGKTNNGSTHIFLAGLKQKKKQYVICPLSPPRIIYLVSTITSTILKGEHHCDDRKKQGNNH